MITTISICYFPLLHRMNIAMASLYIEAFYSSYLGSEYTLAVTQYHSDPMTLICWYEQVPSVQQTHYSVRLIDSETQQVLAIKKISSQCFRHFLHRDTKYIYKHL